MNNKEKEILKFKNNIKKLQKDSGIRELFDNLYITSEGFIGYTEICSECGCVCLNDTHICMPFLNIDKDTFIKIAKEFSSNITTKDRLLSNNTPLCHCSDIKYEFLDDRWVYIGDIEDFDY